MRVFSRTSPQIDLEVSGNIWIFVWKSTEHGIVRIYIMHSKLKALLKMFLWYEDKY